MHFLFILLLSSQSTLATTTSSHLSDKSIRTPAGTRYTVEAIDPTNTAETEAQLKSLYGDNNVVIDGHGDESASWTITADGDDLTGTIEALESVRMVQPKDAPQTGTGEGRRRLSRRNNGIYTVFAKKPNCSTDTKATEEFLRSKIQPGTHIYHFSNKNGDITAWWGLRLDPDAKVAVENHEGVGKVSDDPGTNYAQQQNVLEKASSPPQTGTSPPKPSASCLV